MNMDSQAVNERAVASVRMDVVQSGAAINFTFIGPHGTMATGRLQLWAPPLEFIQKETGWGTALSIFQREAGSGRRRRVWALRVIPLQDPSGFHLLESTVLSDSSFELSFP